MTASVQTAPVEVPAAVPAKAARVRRPVGRLGRRVPFARAVGPLVLLAVWWVASAAGWLDPQTLASPSDVATTTGDLIAGGELQKHLLVSLQRAALGLAFGVSAGVLLALAAGLSRVGEALLDGTLQLLRSLPILALVPLAILWFGIGEEVKVILVALGTLFPVYINTHAALTGLDVRYAELAQTLGLSRTAFLRRIVLPGAAPGFFTGLRISVTVSWLVLVVSEQINASSGIGYLMTQARTFARTDVIVVGLVVYGVLGLASDTLVRLVERRVLAWRTTLG
ncbi:ABC transporter permease [Streptomyces sp. NBC_01465]|uniref:ABC transporter permease n=1 Tax=Streptomyces sp. NBC_01465 TaxID=2903878 RepID=UPI002E32DD61|nr:ABC transporter permease [Streptomyces sp. NBC_01465]